MGISEIVRYFVEEESQDRGVVGIMLFGSFAKGKVRSASDIDFLVLSKNINERSRIIRREGGFSIEVHRWPLNLFKGPFFGDVSDPLQYAFCMEVMQSGEIVYDPMGILQRFKRYAENQKVPPSVIRSLTERTHACLRLAKHFLKEEELEAGEIEARTAAEELARAMLLDSNILEINPPKNYLPHLRSEFPDYYDIFREIHNIYDINVEGIEYAIRDISNWCEKIRRAVKSAQRSDLNELIKSIDGSETELSNANDCLERGEFEGATLQVRYAALILTYPIAKIVRGISLSSRGMRYIELARSDHPYCEALRSVMNFRQSGDKLEEAIEMLEDVIQQF